MAKSLTDMTTLELAAVAVRFWFPDVISILKEKTGIVDQVELYNKVQELAKQQTRIWDEQWAQIYREGATFRFGESPSIWETVRTYLPRQGTFGPHQYALARQQGTPYFRPFDDRRIFDMTRVDAERLYERNSGIIRPSEGTSKRRTLTAEQHERWSCFSDAYQLFRHENDLFETVAVFNQPNVSVCSKNEVLVARSCTKPQYQEFMPCDVKKMSLVAMPSPSIITTPPKIDSTGALIMDAIQSSGLMKFGATTRWYKSLWTLEHEMESTQ